MDLTTLVADLLFLLLRHKKPLSLFGQHSCRVIYGIDLLVMFQCNKRDDLS